jgi:ribonuclease HI
MESDAAIVMRLEQELLEPATRADVARVSALLADDFREVGVSGLAFGKAEALRWLPSESGKVFTVSSMQAAALSEGVILLTYQAEKMHGGQTTRSLRSSVWVKNQSGWQMRYHQGTAAA